MNEINENYKKKLPRHIIVDEKCFRKMDMLLEEGHVFISAGTGYGKSTFASAWLSVRNKNCIWLNVSKADNAEGILQQRLNTSIEACKKNAEAFIVVIDSIENLKDENVIDNLYNYIFREQENLIFVIISSERPKGKFLERVFKGELGLINQFDLEFGNGQVKKYFEQEGHRLDEKKINDIAEYSQGWITAISYFAALKQDILDELDLPNLMTFDLYKYFKTKLWDNLSSSEKSFLLKTSELEFFAVDICNILTDRTDSFYILNSLYERNCFITDVHKSCCKYHPIFRRFLQEEIIISNEIISSDSYKKAALWFKERNHIYCSAELYIKANCVKETERLLFYNSGDLVEYSEKLLEISKKINALPPIFLLKLAWISFENGNSNDMQSCIRAFESYLEDSDYQLSKNTNMFFFYTFLKLITPKNNTSEIISILISGSDKLPVNFQNPLISISNNMTSFLRGIIDFSKMIGEIDLFIENLSPVVERFKSAETLIYILRAESDYQFNRLSEALKHLQQAKIASLASYCIEVHFIILSQITLVYNALSKPLLQNITLNETKSIIDPNIYKNLYLNHQAFETMLKLEQNDTDIAASWLKQNNAPKKLKFYEIEQYFTTAKSFIVLNEYDSAINILLQLEELCKSYMRILDLIEVYILKSVCFLKKNMDTYSVNQIYNAVMLSQPHGFLRIYLDAPITLIPLERLLRRYKYYELWGMDTDYVNLIISKLKSEKEQRNTEQQVSLSKMQTVMLNCLYKDMSYNEICNTTGLKITTVRSHITKLYEKLDVSNKTMAIIKAKNWGLLE